MSQNFQNFAEQTTSEDQGIQYYWQEMGLKQDPFSEEASILFRISQWENYAELIQHLIQHNRVLQVVWGLPGIGKTCFIERFKQFSKDQIEIHTASADEDWTREHLASHVVMSLGLGSIDTKRSIDFIIDHVQNDNKTHLIVIDNAELLNEEVCQALKEWITKLPELNSKLHFLLISDNTFPKKINAIFKNQREENLIHLFELKPFGIEQTRAYIEHRLLQAGYEGEPIFTNKDVKSIYKISKGSLAHINQSSRLILMNKLFGESRRYAKTILSHRKILIIGGILLVVLSYFIIRNSQNLTISQFEENLAIPDNVNIANLEEDNDDELNSELSNVRLVSDDTHTNTMLGTNQLKGDLNTNLKVASSGNKDLSSKQTNDVITEQQDNPGDQQNGQPALDIDAQNQLHLNDQNEMPLKDNLSGAEQLNEENLPLNHINSEFYQVEDKTENETLSALKENLPQAGSVKDSAKQNNNLPKSKLGHATTSGISNHEHSRQLALADTTGIETGSSQISNREKSILKKDALHYTIQLIAATDEETAKKFIDHLKLPHDQITYFGSSFKGEPWFAVIYGSYPDKASAKAALLNLPSELKKNQPWLRRYSDVHKLIKYRTIA